MTAPDIPPPLSAQENYRRAQLLNRCCPSCGSEDIEEVYTLREYRHPLLDQVYKKDVLKQCQKCRKIWVGSPIPEK